MPQVARPTPSPRSAGTILATLLAAYASFYLCRANVDSALSAALGAQYAYDNEQLGRIGTVSVAAYAVGKVLLGALGDVLGGKRIMLLAMVGSVAASFALGLREWPAVLGLAGGLSVFILLASLNRFFQSGGWGGLLKIVAAWFPPERSGRVMGLLSTSYAVGDIAAQLLCAGLFALGFGWRALFVVNPAIFAVVTVAAAVLLRNAPDARAVAAPREPANDDAKLSEVLPVLLRSGAFWVTVALSVLLTFVRTGFMSWTAKYLLELATAEQASSPLAGAVAKSTFFGIAGIAGSIVVGRVSDRFGPGRRAPVMVVSLALLVAAVLVLAHAGFRSTNAAALVIGVCGLFLFGPYSLLAGAVALDVAGKRAASTAAGIIDGAGYLGASVAPLALGILSKRSGWPAAFDLLAAAAATAMLVSLGWAIASARRSARA